MADFPTLRNLSNERNFNGEEAIRFLIEEEILPDCSICDNCGTWYGIKLKTPTRHRTDFELQEDLLCFMWSRQHSMDLWRGFINLLLDLEYVAEDNEDPDHEHFNDPDEHVLDPFPERAAAALAADERI